MINDTVHLAFYGKDPADEEVLISDAEYMGAMTSLRRCINWAESPNLRLDARYIGSHEHNGPGNTYSYYLGGGIVQLQTGIGKLNLSHDEESGLIRLAEFLEIPQPSKILTLSPSKVRRW